MRNSLLIGSLFFLWISAVSAQPATQAEASAQPPAPAKVAEEELKVEVGASREQLETIREQNRKLEEQTRFLEQEVQRLREALRDDKGPQGAAVETATPSVAAQANDSAMTSGGPAAGQDSTPASDTPEAVAAKSGPYSGVVLGGMILLLGYWSVLGPYVRIRKGFFRAQA